MSQNTKWPIAKEFPTKEIQVSKKRLSALTANSNGFHRDQFAMIWDMLERIFSHFCGKNTQTFLQDIAESVLSVCRNLGHSYCFVYLIQSWYIPQPNIVFLHVHSDKMLLQSCIIICSFTTLCWDAMRPDYIYKLHISYLHSQSSAIT